jgi:hypothetical protein
VEDPELLNPDRQRSLEDQIRLSGYRRSLERILRLKDQLEAAPAEEEGTAAALRDLRRQFSISPGEESRVLDALSAAEGAARRNAVLLDRLAQLCGLEAALRHPLLAGQPQLVALLDDQIRHRQDVILRVVLDGLATPGAQPAALEQAARLPRLAPLALESLLATEPWRERLPRPVLEVLLQPSAAPVSPSVPGTVEATLERLEPLAADPLPVVAAAAVALGFSLDSSWGRARAEALLQRSEPGWLRETAAAVHDLEGPLSLASLPALEKRVVLATSDFFKRTWADTLDVLADQAEIRAYGAGGLITEAGDTCRELLLLMEGAARVEHRGGGGGEGWVERMRPGQVLDELEVLSHSAAESTIVAETAGTRVLAVPVDSFDTTLERDPDFARRVLALETRQLQRLTRQPAL